MAPLINKRRCERRRGCRVFNAVQSAAEVTEPAPQTTACVVGALASPPHPSPMRSPLSSSGAAVTILTYTHTNSLSFSLISSHLMMSTSAGAHGAAGGDDERALTALAPRNSLTAPIMDAFGDRSSTITTISLHHFVERQALECRHAWM